MAAQQRDAQIIPMPQRDRCTNLVNGRPCRNYAIQDGLCRVCLPIDERPVVDRTIPELRPRGGIDILEGLRDALGEEWLSHIRELAGFLRRRITGDYDVDEFGFDVDLTEHVIIPLLRPFYRHYWRVSSHGTEHLPTHGGALLVANHAGTVPADALMTRLDILEHTGRHTRELGADLIFRTPFIGALGRKTGGTVANHADADRLLGDGRIVSVFPEGFKGIGKPFSQRYKLQRFGRGGFVSAALRAQVPIVPAAIIGSEEIYPLLYDLKPLARVLGLPYFPIVPQMLLGPAAVIPLPSKWAITYGEPIDTTGLDADAADDPMTVFEIADQVRDQIQHMLYDGLMGRRSVFW